jgi:hypothetical protein
MHDFFTAQAIFKHLAHVLASKAAVQIKAVQVLKPYTAVC